MCRHLQLVVLTALAACGPEPFEDTGVDAATHSTTTDARLADAAAITPDAQYVACPPGLPDSFGLMGFVTTTKNGPGLDSTDGGPSLHMFGRKGRLVITSTSTDQTRVSGRLEDVILDAIKVVYDGPACSGIDDPICGNSICLNNKCGRQQLLAGCSTSIKSMTF